MKEDLRLKSPNRRRLADLLRTERNPVWLTIAIAAIGIIATTAAAVVPGCIDRQRESARETQAAKQAHTRAGLDFLHQVFLTADAASRFEGEFQRYSDAFSAGAPADLIDTLSSQAAASQERFIEQQIELDAAIRNLELAGGAPPGFADDSGQPVFPERLRFDTVADLYRDAHPRFRETMIEEFRQPNENLINLLRSLKEFLRTAYNEFSKELVESR